MYDIVIIGRGPAGISALSMRRANPSVAVIGKDMGSLAKAGKIENYYGLDVPLPVRNCPPRRGFRQCASGLRCRKA